MAFTTKNSKSVAVLSIAIFLIICAIHLPWIDFYGKPVGDTPGYMDVAKNWFSSDFIYIRPILYPLFLCLAQILTTNEFGAIVPIQILFYSLSAVFFFRIIISSHLKINRYILAVITIISFSAPQALYSNEVVLPEMLPLIFILFFLYFLQKESNLKNSITIGMLIIIPILFKPLWILLFLLPILKYIYVQKNRRNLVYGLLMPIGLSLFIYSIYQYTVAKSGTNAVAASTFDMNINLSLIRMGLIEGSEDTRLYHFLDKKKLVEEISHRKWSNNKEEFKRFTEIKNQIPTGYREDSEFWKTILFQNPKNLIRYLSCQVTRVPDFFSTSAANHQVKFLPQYFNRLYQSFFYNVHSKYLIGISFIIFAFSAGLFKFNSWDFNKSLVFTILGAALVICLLVYQNAHFLRMRAIIEPFLIYIFLLCIYKGLFFLKSKVALPIK
jgi:hypothetical protein